MYFNIFYVILRAVALGVQPFDQTRLTERLSENRANTRV